jgi:hypothetical protein
MIGIMNIATGRIVNGGIAGQCQESYFYGKEPRCEALLKGVEDAIGPALQEICKTESVSEKNRACLCFFVPTLYLRTRKRTEIFKVGQKHIALEVIKDGIAKGKLPPPPEKLTPDLFDFSGVPEFLLQHALGLMFECVTLGCKLLRAAPSASFFTSDNPVVTMNEFAYLFDGVRTCAGFGQCGFQLLLPISPRLCLILYDLKVYKVGGRRESCVQLAEAETEIVNSLQVQAAEECLYFSDDSSRAQLERLVSRYKKQRVPVQAHLTELPRVNPRETLLVQTASTIKPPRNLNVVRFRKNVNGSPGERRNPDFTTAIDQLYRDLLENPSGGDLLSRIENLGDRENVA